MEKLKIRIITPDDIHVIEDVSSITLSAIDGELTILPKHYPLMTAIDVSKVKFIKDKNPIYGFISDGLLNVKEHEVILILNAFEFKDEIDIARAKASYERAYKRINSKQENIDIARAEASLKRALTRMSIAQK